MPHPGEHGVPLAINVHVTPALLGSFCTDALNCAEKLLSAPAASSVTLLWMITTVAGTVTTIEVNLETCATDVAVIFTVRSEGIAVGALYVTDVVD